MSSVNITITHDELVHYNQDVGDKCPYNVSAWFVDKRDGTVVCAERDGINPLNLVGEVLADLNTQLDAVEVS
jgi:hypothetical protein